MLLLLAAAIAFTREPDFDDEEIDFDALDEWAAADAGRPLPPTEEAVRPMHAVATAEDVETWYAENGVRVPMYSSDG